MNQCAILQYFTLNRATTCTGLSGKGLRNRELPQWRRETHKEKNLFPIQFIKKKKKKYWVQFSGHNFYVEMHNNKWQKSACFGMLSILISGLIVHNNDVSLLFLFQLVEAGLDVLVVNNFSCKSCRCWTFVFLKMFWEVPSIVTCFRALPVLTAGENCTWSNFWPL